MRFTLLAAAALPLIAGCNDGIVVSFDDAECSTWTCFFKPGLSVTGSVRIGPHHADDYEAIVYLYDPSDTVHAVESVSTYWPGGFTVSYWRNPGRNVCEFLARAVLWTGEATELQPLFDAPPRPCVPDAKVHEGADFTFDAYPPLDAPFVIRGRVLVDDVPRATDVSVLVRDTIGALDRTWLTTRSDATGEYRLETLDLAQRFSWCRLTRAEVPRAGDDVLRMGMGRIEDELCTDSLRLPDLRLGVYHAVSGRVYVFDGDANPSLAGPGEATVTLLDPADSSAVSDPAEILADRTFDVWFPVWLSQGAFPGCDWLLRVDLGDGRSSTELMRSPDSTLPCGEWSFRTLLVE